jgi:hypothetical protein
MLENADSLGRMTVEYKKAPGRALCDQTRAGVTSLGGSNQARMESNIQANLGGCRGRNEHVPWRRGGSEAT